MKLTYYNNGVDASQIYIKLKETGKDILLHARPVLHCNFSYKDAWDSRIISNENQEMIVYDTPNFVEIFWMNADYPFSGYIHEGGGNRHRMKIHKYHKIPMADVMYIDVTPIYLASVRE